MSEIAPMIVSRAILGRIKETIGLQPPENGGFLGGDRRNGRVLFYRFDASGKRTGASYSPDHESLNWLLSTQWNPAGIHLLGFVHSHPGSLRNPSSGDLAYAIRILDAIPELDRLLLPIVTRTPDGSVWIEVMAAVRRPGGVELVDVPLVIED